MVIQLIESILPLYLPIPFTDLKLAISNAPDIRVADTISGQIDSLRVRILGDEDRVVATLFEGGQLTN